MCNINEATKLSKCDDTGESCNCCLTCRNTCSWDKFLDIEDEIENNACDKKLIDIYKRNKKET